MLSVLAPGMVWGRRFGGLDSSIDVFRVNDFGLVGEFLESGIGQGFVFVEDGNFSFGIFTDSDLGIPQGIVRAVGLDLVNDLLVLNGQVFGEYADFLAGEDQIQVFGLEQGAMGIMVAARGYRKTLVESFAELRQVGIPSLDGGDAT
jgi:hypothetical protein